MCKITEEKLGFRYLRIWGIFSRKLLIDVNQSDGNFNFVKLNQVFDFFYYHQIFPHIELGPKHFQIDATTRKELRHQRQEVLYKSEKFRAVFDAFLKHFTHRYGQDVVSKWRFELWLDEEELSYEFSIMDYFTIFKEIQTIAKKYSSEIQVGGCGYPMNFVKNLPEDFFKQWVNSEARPDFCSMMVYHYDLYKRDGVTLSNRSQDQDFLLHAVEGFTAKLAEVGWEHIPIFVTEWNVSISDRNLMNDSLFKGSCILQNIFEMSDRVNSLAYFIGSDWVSDDVDSIHLLHGGSGLLSRNLFLKPAAWTYQFLQQLDKFMVLQTENLILTTNGDGQYTLLVHNVKELNDLYFSTEEDDLDLTNLNQYVSDLEEKTIRLTLKGLSSGRYRIKTSDISYQNELQSIWKSMNYADDLNLEELEYIQGRSLPEITLSEQYIQDNQLQIDLSLSANSFKLMKILPA